MEDEVKDSSITIRGGIVFYRQKRYSSIRHIAEDIMQDTSVRTASVVMVTYDDKTLLNRVLKGILKVYNEPEE